MDVVRNKRLSGSPHLSAPRRFCEHGNERIIGTRMRNANLNMENRIVDTKTVVAYYWEFHSERSERFDTIEEAFNFLNSGSIRHEFVMDKIGLTDETAVLSREDLAELKKLSPLDRAIRLGILDRLHTSSA